MANPAKEVLFAAERRLEQEATDRVEAEFENVKSAFVIDPTAAISEAIDGISRLALEEFLPRAAKVAVDAADRLAG